MRWWRQKCVHQPPGIEKESHWVSLLSHTNAVISLFVEVCFLKEVRSKKFEIWAMSLDQGQDRLSLSLLLLEKCRVRWAYVRVGLSYLSCCLMSWSAWWCYDRGLLLYICAVSGYMVTSFQRRSPFTPRTWWALRLSPFHRVCSDSQWFSNVSWESMVQFHFFKGSTDLMEIETDRIMST
jgi:hypothetical protein